MDRQELGFLRYLTSIVITALIVGFLVSIWVVEHEQDGCERRQPIFEEIARTVEDASATATTNQGRAVFEARARRIRENIVEDCSNAFPHILPFID